MKFRPDMNRHPNLALENAKARPPRPIVDASTRDAQPRTTRILANAKQARTLANLLPKLLSGEQIVGMAGLANSGE
jgi:hypothetical protein